MAIWQTETVARQCDNGAKGGAGDALTSRHLTDNLRGGARMGDRTRSQEERFWSKVDATGVCWEWTGATVQGYGAFGSSENRVGSQRAHRWAYEHLVGAVPPDLTLDHLCRNRACVNPDHLEAVVHEINVLRGSSPPAMNARKTHCANGHEFTAENTYMALSGSGRSYRQCRTCHLAFSRAYKARRRGTRPAGDA